MNPISRLLALSLLAVCGPAAAQILGTGGPDIAFATDDRGPGGRLDGFAVLDNRLVAETDTVRTRVAEEDDLRGVGAETRFDLLPGVFLTGEYRRTRYGRVVTTNLNTGAESGTTGDGHLTTIRGGGGVGARVAGIPMYVRGEFSSLKLTGPRNSDGRQNGYGVLAGVSGALNRYVGVEGEVGYQDNDDFGRGLEYRVGGWLNVLPNLALTLHYRRTRLERGTVLAGDAYLETGGAGLRFQFGGYGLPLPGPGAGRR